MGVSCIVAALVAAVAASILAKAGGQTAGIATSPVCLVALPRPSGPAEARAWNDLVDVALPASQAVGVRTGKLRLGMLVENTGGCAARWDEDALSFRPGRGWYSMSMLYVQHADEAALAVADVPTGTEAGVSILRALRSGVLSGRVSYGGVPADLGGAGSGVVAVSVGPARSGDMLDGAAALAWARSGSTAAVAVRQPVEAMRVDACSEAVLGGELGSGTDAAASFFREVWAGMSSGEGTDAPVAGGSGLECSHQLGQALYPLRSVPHIAVHPLPPLPRHAAPTPHGTTCPETGLRWGMTEANVAATVASAAHPSWESDSPAPSWASDKPPRWRQVLEARVLSARRGETGPWQLVICDAGAQPVSVVSPDRPAALSEPARARWAAELGMTTLDGTFSSSFLSYTVRLAGSGLLNYTADTATQCADAGSWDPSVRLTARIHRRMSEILPAFSPALVTLRSALIVAPWLGAASRQTVRGNAGAPKPGSNPFFGRSASPLEAATAEADAVTAGAMLSITALASMSFAPAYPAVHGSLHSSPGHAFPSLNYVGAWHDPPRAVAPQSPDERPSGRVLCLDVDGFRDGTNTAAPAGLCGEALTELGGTHATASMAASGVSPELLHAVAGSHAGDVPSAGLLVASPDVGAFQVSERLMQRKLAATRLVHAMGVPSVAVARRSDWGGVPASDLEVTWHPEAAEDEPVGASSVLLGHVAASGAAALQRDGGETTDVNASVSGLNGAYFASVASGGVLRAPASASAPAAWRRLRGLRARDDLIAARERRARRFRPLADDSALPRLRGLRALGRAATAAAASGAFGDDAATHGLGRAIEAGMRKQAWASPETPLDPAELFPTPYHDNFSPERGDIATESLAQAASRAILSRRAEGSLGPGAAPIRLRYLEIGCQGDFTFRVMQLRLRSTLQQRLGASAQEASLVELQRFGVDPVRGGNLRMTSDAFFADPRFRSVRFHTVFVDGLHEAQQALRDVENALGRLEDGGAIVMHDLGAPSRRMELWPADPSDRTDSALSHDGPHRSPWSMPAHGWNGDTWRALAALVTRPDVVSAMVQTDHGVGVVRRGVNPRPVVLPAPALPRSRTLGDDGAVDVVSGEPDAERRSMEASARRQVHAWSEDDAMAPGAAEALSGPPDATGQTPCDDDSDRMFTLLTRRHEVGTPTDAEVERAVAAGDAAMERLFSTSRPLLTHPAVRCLRGQLGESRDDLRVKDAIEELAGVSDRVLGWGEWVSSVGYTVTRLAPSEVPQWLGL